MLCSIDVVAINTKILGVIEASICLLISNSRFLMKCSDIDKESEISKGQ